MKEKKPMLMLGIGTGPKAESDDGLMAAKDLLKALERKKPEDVLSAFEDLYQHCMDKEDYDEEDKGDE